ncbi:MAG: hypothetical protein IPH28_15785 [Cytophagaceae bacterium]|nr:hypothetical protein [Cytophagaceae bacterium]
MKKVLATLFIIIEIIKAVFYILLSFSIPYLIVWQILNSNLKIFGNIDDPKIQYYFILTFGSILVHFLSEKINSLFNSYSLNQFSPYKKRVFTLEYRIEKRRIEERIKFSQNLLNTQIFALMIYILFFIIIIYSSFIDLTLKVKFPEYIIYSFSSYIAYDRIRKGWSSFNINKDFLKMLKR